MLIAVLATATLIAGCGSAAVAPGDEGDAYPDYLQLMLQEARGSGLASDVQIGILERAAEAKALAWVDYRDAVMATLDCFDRAGLPYVGPAESTEAGVRVLSYAVQTGQPAGTSTTPGAMPPESERTITAEPDTRTGHSPGPQEALAEECRAANSRYVEAAWAAQPTSLETQDRYFEQRRAAIVACAEDAGLAVDESAPIRDMFAALIAQGEQGRHCLRENGVTSF